MGGKAEQTMGKIHSSADMVCLCIVTRGCTVEELLPTSVCGIIMLTCGRYTDVSSLGLSTLCLCIWQRSAQHALCCLLLRKGDTEEVSHLIKDFYNWVLVALLHCQFMHHFVL